MLVCHCRAVNEARVRALIADGARDEFDIADACGAGSDCGGCVPTISRLLDDAVAPCSGGVLGCEVRSALRAAAPEHAHSAPRP